MQLTNPRHITAIAGLAGEFCIDHVDELNSAPGDAVHELGIVALAETTIEVPVYPTSTRDR